MNISSLKMIRNSILAGNLQRIMHLQNKTIEQVCEDLGISLPMFYFWIFAIRYPKLSEIKMLAKYFDVKKSELIEYQSDFEENDYILSYDYSQIELRVVAGLADEKALIDAFNSGIDIHTKTASDIFGVDIKDVTSDMRRQAKAINFGIIYGMSDFGLSNQVGVSMMEAKQFIDKYFASYPGIKIYMDKQIQFCQENGYVCTMMNRRRYIPEINEKNFMRRELGKRLAMNTPIQGSAADLLKLAMIKVDRLMKEKKVQSKMILQVHDELVFDVKKEELEVMSEIIREGMEQVYPMKVSLKAEGSYGKTWYDLK